MCTIAKRLILARQREAGANKASALTALHVVLVNAQRAGRTVYACVQATANGPALRYVGITPPTPAELHQWGPEGWCSAGGSTTAEELLAICQTEEANAHTWPRAVCWCWCGRGCECGCECPLTRPAMPGYSVKACRLYTNVYG